MTRNILFLTGTRADFGKLEPLSTAAQNNGFSVTFFVTGMHMLERYGMTKAEVHRVEGAKVYEFLNQRHGDGQDVILAKTIIGFSDFIAENRPDLIVVHGDRIEALAGAMVAATNYIPSAHIEGGEVSGTIDEIFRHCNTKLAAHHFVSSDQAKSRVLAMGEAGETVHVIGSPELDFHAEPSGITIHQVRERYDIEFEDYGIAIFHPVTSEQTTIGIQAQILFDALTASRKDFVVIAPNNDPGSEHIFEILKQLPKRQFRILPSMRFSHFSELMKNASCLVGNSSAGVREAPFIGIPSLDVGTRQTNRAQSKSVRMTNGHDQNSITRFLDEKWGLNYKKHAGFGEGKAADRFINVLNRSSFWNFNLQKAFNDNV